MNSMTSPGGRASHVFAVPAFGEPHWLERCVRSLQRQSVPSSIVITTSTPNSHVAAVAQRCEVPLVVNPRAGGIASDWNFALDQARTGWVTLAHQDDWYEPRYVEACLAAVAESLRTILVFTGATETLDGDARTLLNTRVKRLISRAAFLGGRSIDAAWRKRLLLSFGNPIPCPSVMINRDEARDFRFPEGWKSNLDWRAWCDLAVRPGSFVYLPDSLVHRTMHRDAETTRALTERAIEDARMFRELWPAPVAAALNVLYAPSRHVYATLRHER